MSPCYHLKVVESKGNVKPETVYRVQSIGKHVLTVNKGPNNV